MVSIKKVKELIQRGCCVVDVDDASTHQQAEQPQNVEEEQVLGMEEQPREQENVPNTNEPATAAEVPPPPPTPAAAAEQQQQETDNNNVPVLTEDEEEEEEELEPENEIYQTEYYSFIDPERISLSFNQTYEEYQDMLEFKHHNFIFVDDPWELNKTIPNAYEYVNPALEEEGSGPHYDANASKTDDDTNNDYETKTPEIYQLNYTYMDPQEVDKSYNYMSVKYYDFLRVMNSLDSNEEDPWKFGVTMLHPFHYFMPAEINPYLVSHPFTEEEGAESKDYIYQTEEYEPLDALTVHHEFQKEYQKYQDLMKEQDANPKLVRVDPWH